ncbi:MAG: phosphotransferase [Acidobacteria bacterium]|nr:phosphotransferase [Acidobacteriota bacterium]
MTDAHLPAAVADYLRRHHVESAGVVPLTGDASDRRYFRVLPRTGSSYVLAVYAAPFDFATLPFVNVATLLAEMPVPIPHVRGEASDLGVLALDDLGDLTLQASIGAANADERLALYRQAVSYIEIFQRRGRELMRAEFLPYGVAFDVDKLTWEMNFFIKHFLEGYRGASIVPADRAALDAELLRISRELSAEPRVLCHRDYHSRNLMLVGGRLYVIDFQDARMGPDTYDLVSLLRDSYVDLPDEVVDRLLEEYLAMTGRAGAGQHFRQRFDLMALQRNLKALGTFGYQMTVRSNPVYLQYIPRTLRYVHDNLQRHQRFARLRELLGTYVAELRP